MKVNLFLIIILVFIISCQQATNKEEENINQIIEQEINQPVLEEEISEQDEHIFGTPIKEEQEFINNHYPKIDNTPDLILGTYYGKLKEEKINFTLYEVKDGKAKAYSISKGMLKKWTGKVDFASETNYVFEFFEDGAEDENGFLSLNLDINVEIMDGQWNENSDRNQESTSIVLEKGLFSYNQNNGDYSYVSTRLLTHEDVNNESAYGLAVMRNEVFARHGYSFGSEKWQIRFNATEWYWPNGLDIRSQLTEIESANLSFILDYEEFVDEYIDGFSR